MYNCVARKDKYIITFRTEAFTYIKEVVSHAKEISTFDNYILTFREVVI